MNDREMLEAAARAAGFSEAKWQDMTGGGDVRYGMSEGIWTGETYWNPLTDDGDALRLVVKLNLDIITRVSDRETWAQAPMVRTVIEPHGADPYASTRRAIVRAAAALAEQAAPRCSPVSPGSSSETTL